MPMMLVHAEDLGVRGDASPAELNADAAFMRRLEALRIEAGARMGIADAGNKVIPKPVLLSAPQHGGDLQVRYFMPHQCHTALAITGAVGLATAASSRRARWPTLWSGACPFPAALPSNIRAGTCRWASVAARMTHR